MAMRNQSKTQQQVEHEQRLHREFVTELAELEPDIATLDFTDLRARLGRAVVVGLQEDGHLVRWNGRNNLLDQRPVRWLIDADAEPAGDVLCTHVDLHDVESYVIDKAERFRWIHPRFRYSVHPDRR